MTRWTISNMDWDNYGPYIIRPPIQTSTTGLSRLTSMWPRGASVRDSAYVSKENVCTTKAAVLAVMDHTPHACHTWAGACLIGPETAALWYGTSRAGLLWQLARALTKVHCWRVTIRSVFTGRRRIKLHDRQLGGIFKQTIDCSCLLLLDYYIHSELNHGTLCVCARIDACWWTINIQCS